MILAKASHFNYAALLSAPFSVLVFLLIQQRKCGMEESLGMLPIISLNTTIPTTPFLNFRVFCAKVVLYSQDGNNHFLKKVRGTISA
jgi:hypothetical protein